jgi:hypothetical protein
VVCLFWALGSVWLYRLGPDWWRRQEANIYAERLAYLPSIGILLVLALVAYTIQSGGGPEWVAWVLVVIGFGILVSAITFRQPPWLLPPGYLTEYERRRHRRP